jgi:polysaccharide export outer membrane protein
VAPKAVVARPAPKPAGQLAPRTAPPPGLAYDVLRVGDKLTVRLSDIPNPPEPIEQRVREDGMITLTQGIQVVAANKKPADVEAAIIREYVPKFYTRITVSVKSEERAFYVDGEVKTPNRYVYAAEMTVLKAISVAGGFTEFANKTNVEVTRINGEKPIIVDCKKALRIPKLDIPIYPGDHVFVRKRWM